MVVLCRPALVLALCVQSRLPPAAAQRSPPPHSPPPHPLIPLESGTPLCTREALTNLPVNARPVFTAFGGSNTQGANALSLNLRNGRTEYGPHVPSFANLLQRALGQGFTTHMHADGGSGPSLAGTCTSRFIPPETRVGTVEFLPNIGYIKEDRRGKSLSHHVTTPPPKGDFTTSPSHIPFPYLYATTADRAELAAVKLLLQAMKTHGATAYLVNIMSGSARFARDERFGFCGRYHNVTERDASVIGCMSRARVPNYVETKRDSAGQRGPSG